MKNHVIIGLTGPFGSGCTYVAKEHIEKFGYKYISLSDILRQEFSEQSTEKEDERNNLQEFGNAKRKEHGNDYFARTVFDIINKNDTQEKWVVDSIRNTHEVEFFRKACGQFFFNFCLG